MPGRELVEGLAGFRMPLQRRAQVGGNRKLARFAIEPKLDAYNVANIGVRGLAQLRVDLRSPSPWARFRNLGRLWGDVSRVAAAYIRR